MVFDLATGVVGDLVAYEFDALDAGALDFVTKPSIDVARGLTEMISDLQKKVKIAAVSNVSHWKKPRRVSRRAHMA